MVTRPHMRKVRSKETKPERALRKLIWSMGYRGYRKNCGNLPGRPDVAFTRRKRAIFLHGCFWHGHSCKAGRNVPQTNTTYWIPKLRRNKERDRDDLKKLKSEHWRVMVVWECELGELEQVKSGLSKFLRE